MLKKGSLLLILLIGCLAITTQSKKTDVSELINDVSNGFNKVRNNAENKASELVGEIEQSNIFGNINGSISELVTTIFKGYNMAVDKAENVAKDVVHKIEEELKTNKNKREVKLRLRRDLDTSIDNIKNKTVHLANKIANITNNLEINDKIVGMFDMILNNLETIVTKINTKIMSTLDENSLAKSSEENNETAKFSVTEIDEKKRDITTTTAEDKPITTTTAADKSITTTTAADKPITTTTDAAKSKANDKYKKIADFYKKKYAGKFIYMDEDDKTSDDKKERRRRSIEEESDEEEISADEEEVSADEELEKIKSVKNEKWELTGVNGTKYKEEYRQAGKEFANSLKKLTLEILDEFFDDNKQ